MQQEYVCHRALNAILDQPLTLKDIECTKFVVGAKTGSLAIRTMGSADRHIAAAALAEYDLEAWELGEWLSDNGAVQCGTGWVPTTTVKGHVPDSDYIRVAGGFWQRKPKQNLTWKQDERAFWFQVDLGPDVAWRPDAEGFWKLVAIAPNGGTPPPPMKVEWRQGSKGFWNRVSVPLTAAN